VAYHHAGLSINDRNAVEKAYLEGDINVICCTSTLAVGVNLPCHMVIIKNTVTYSYNGGAGGCKEYSDLEVMQMLGRAGRPQFDKSAVAVILTRLQKQPHYEKMVSAQEVLESCLHRNLIDHVNAEIGLGTITNVSTAKRWLSGTFLYVRLKENPEHYKIDGDTTSRNLEERLEIICSKVISLLLEHDLVQNTPKLHCTEFGDAMARYYIQFESMKTLLALPPRAKTSEILSAIAQASEFGDIRFRGGEKTTYKALNQNSSIKFPIPVNLDAPAHKTSLVIQAVLGAIDFPSEDHKQRADFLTAKSVIFTNVHRLIRCIVDCQLYLQDSVTARNALALARSLGAQVWDDSPLHMKQLDGVGLVTVRKLATAGLKTVDDIENTEQYRLEQLLSRNPSFGGQLQDKAKAFPKLRVGLKTVGEPVSSIILVWCFREVALTPQTIRMGEPVLVRVLADIGFMNEKTPEYFQKKPVYVCLIAELSDGQLLHFARIRCVHCLRPDEHAADYSQCKEAEQGTGSHVRSEVDELHSDCESVRDVRHHR
jgi:ATP-dependent DNA helicase HFM1/MER3